MNILNNYKKIKFFAKNKKNKILIIGGQKSYHKSGANLFFKKLLKNNKVEYYFKNSAYPEIKEVEIIAKIIEKIKPNLIFAIGGGSVMDLAKIGNIIDLKKTLKNKKEVITKKKLAKLIAVPLTAGSGAEATSTAVLYLGKKKISVEGNQVKPDHFFLVSDLVKNTPKKIKGPAIFDCISQAVESLFSLKANSQSAFYALKSLRISINNALDYFNNPNPLNSKKMLLAAHYAGRAIDISRTIASHAISYPFTSLFGFSHGRAIAVSFVAILKYNFSNQRDSFSKKKYEQLFKLTKSKDINELAEYFNNTISRLGIETKKNNSKINFKKNWPIISKNINLKRLLNNPVPLKKIHIKKILENCC